MLIKYNFHPFWKIFSPVRDECFLGNPLQYGPILIKNSDRLFAFLETEVTTEWTSKGSQWDIFSFRPPTWCWWRNLKLKPAYICGIPRTMAWKFYSKHTKGLGNRWNGKKNSMTEFRFKSMKSLVAVYKNLLRCFALRDPSVHNLLRHWCAL